MADPIHLFGGQDEIGYGDSYLSARIGTEILAGVGTGGASVVTKVGWVGKAGKAVWAWDMAGNAVGTIRGGKSIYQDGLGWQNGATLFGNAFGFGGNVAGRIGRGADTMPSNPFGPKSVDAAQVPDPKVLQTGGHTLTNRPRNALGLSKDEAKRAMEGLKRDIGQGSAHASSTSDP